MLERYLYLGGQQDGKWHEMDGRPFDVRPFVRSIAEEFVKAESTEVTSPLEATRQEYVRVDFVDNFLLPGFGSKKSVYIHKSPELLSKENKPIFSLIDMLMSGYRKPAKGIN